MGISSLNLYQSGELNCKECWQIAGPWSLVRYGI